VIAGGREPAHWEAYPNHQFISTNGALPCCAQGGCWKSRCQLVGDGDPKDSHNVCEQPVHVREDLCIPKCMEIIKPEHVIQRLQLYYEGRVMGEPSPDLAVAALRDHDEPDTRIHAPAVVRQKQHRILIEFRHGLGDAVQLTVVLQHLRHLRPEWCVDVAALVGKHSAYYGLCRDVLVMDGERSDRSAYSQVHALDWHEARTAHAQWPSTKATRCLTEVFGLQPVAELCRYKIQVPDEIRSAAREYLAAICRRGPNEDGRYPAVLIHYEGNTSPDRKNLPHEIIRDVCDVARHHHVVPVILDWDRRSPLIDNEVIHNPGAEHPLWGGSGTGDAQTLAALIDASALMIGVDSGPLHVAGATDTPTIGVWTQHHPVHFFDLADNVLHLVPGNHDQLTYGPEATAFFREHYRHHEYKQISVELPAMVESLITGEDFARLADHRFHQRLSSRSFDARYYEEHKHAGLDYLGFGIWQQQYGRWLVESLQWEGKRVLDVGCACGSILRGLGQAGAVVQGVDVCEHMIRLGREQWPDITPLLFVCDAVNLHLFADGSCDAVHTAQVAEHWKPELVPHTLRELHRVVKPKGLLFCALDTAELMARQQRDASQEDPTHVCIRPCFWWFEQLAVAGWDVCSDEFTDRLQAHPESFLKRYDWDWFVARRR
jgi:SAM-dependent methyltransferase